MGKGNRDMSSQNTEVENPQRTDTNPSKFLNNLLPPIPGKAANLSPSLSANKRKSVLQRDHVKQKMWLVQRGQRDRRLESTGV